MATATRTRPQVYERTATLEGRDPRFIAFLLLRVAFVVAPIVAGLDKFFDWLADWEAYLWPAVEDALPWSAGEIMGAVGIIEIAAGLVVLIAPRIGAPLVAAWLGTIIVNLVAHSIDEGEKYWDIALRDFGLMIAAIALFLLATMYRGTLRASANR